MPSRTLAGRHPFFCVGHARGCSCRAPVRPRACAGVLPVRLSGLAPARVFLRCACPASRPRGGPGCPRAPSRDGIHFSVPATRAGVLAVRLSGLAPARVCLPHAAATAPAHRKRTRAAAPDARAHPRGTASTFLCRPRARVFLPCACPASRPRGCVCPTLPQLHPRTANAPARRHRMPARTLAGRHPLCAGPITRARAGVLATRCRNCTRAPQTHPRGGASRRPAAAPPGASRSGTAAGAGRRPRRPLAGSLTRPRGPAPEGPSR
ncbi:hypothetical protein ABIE24_002392 [Mycetocola sp. 2940]